VWSADIPGAAPGDEYKYFINGNIWKRDPRNRLEVSSGGDSIIYDPTAFNWGSDNFAPIPLEQLAIYELHVGTFYDSTPGNGYPGQFTDAILKLGYLKGLGFNAVELMPIAEFPGELSWGYNLSDPYAVENLGYGGPDVFKDFVKACHTNGIAVFLDVVHNHYGPSDMDLWDFDGWTGGGTEGGIYFYQGSNICCTPYGSRPNYGRQLVRDYIQDNFQMWLDEYHVDGFRWDTPGLMFNASGYGTVTEAITLIQTITSMIHSNYSGKLDIAEDVTGMGFDSTWALGFPGAVRTPLIQSADENRDVNSIAAQINGSGAGLSRVVFMESHDVVGDLNGGVRLPTAIDTNTPDSYWARKRSTLGAALAFTSPGVPMIFQGEEMLENQQFSSSRPVDWSKTITYSNIVALYRDLVHLRRNLSDVSIGLEGEGCAVFQVDDSNKLVAYRRWKAGVTNRDVIVVLNFANAIRSNYQLPFSNAGTWYVHFNSDSKVYGTDYGNAGSAVVSATGNQATGGITVGPYSALILSQTPPSPALSIKQTNGLVNVAWTTPPSGWVLDKTSAISSNSSSWTQVPAGQYQTNGTVVSFTFVPQSGGAFYRLRKP